MFYKVFICVLAFLFFGETFKILLVFLIPYKSHHFLARSMINLLLEAGHEVTYMTSIPFDKSHSNLSQIEIKLHNFKAINFTKVSQQTTNIKGAFDQALNITHTALTSENVQRLLENPAQTFDLVVSAWLFSDVNSGLSALFNCPFIWFFTFQDDHEILRLIHEFPNPSVTTNMRTNNVPVLNFMQRAQELLFLITSRATKYLHFDPLEKEVYEKIFGPLIAKRGRTLPPYEEVRYNASLGLVNSHITLRDIPMIPQNYKTVGGFHIPNTLDPLNKELLDVIENSQNGVILFSLGTFLRPEDLPQHIKSDLLAMFSSLNYTILWKIDENFKDLPSNVQTLHWIPIQRVLAHPKCVLFITHGGMLSLTESVHFGVPIVGVPVYGDQTVNVKTLAKKGVGRIVAMGPKLADNLKDAIEHVLSDPGYRQNMKALSKLYHDRPMSPGSELVYWVEHVVRTQGAPHLRSSSLQLAWYQKCYIDVFAAFLMCLTISLLIIIKVFTYVVYRIKMYKLRLNDETFSKKSM